MKLQYFDLVVHQSTHVTGKSFIPSYVGNFWCFTSSSRLYNKTIQNCRLGPGWYWYWRGGRGGISLWYKLQMWKWDNTQKKHPKETPFWSSKNHKNHNGRCGSNMFQPPPPSQRDEGATSAASMRCYLVGCQWPSTFDADLGSSIRGTPWDLR